MTNATAQTIAEFMDELASYKGQTVVVKIGGNSIDEDPAFLGSLAAQLAFLQKHGVRIVLVHGGGPQIDRALAAANLQVAKNPDGRRPTSPAMMTVVANTMAEISRTVGEALSKQNCAVYVAAESAGYKVRATPLYENVSLDEDRTGMPTTVDALALRQPLVQGKIVVMSSVCGGPQDLPFNTNADDCAMAVAMALGARRLVMATNVPGVYDANKNIIERLTPDMARRLFEDGTIAGGMIPKVESALRSLEAGVGGVAIIDAHQPWGLLTELLTHKGLGTLIAPDA